MSLGIITRGTTAKFDWYGSDYDPAVDTAELILKRLTDSQSYTMAADPDDSAQFLVKLTPTETLALDCVGVWSWFVRITVAAGDVTIADRGEIFVAGDPTQPFDDRTEFERDLENVDAAIRKIIEGGAVQSYQVHTLVGQRHLQRMTLEELRNHRRWLQGQIDRENQLLGKPRKGNNRFLKIRPRLGRNCARRR